MGKKRIFDYIEVVIASGTSVSNSFQVRSDMNFIGAIIPDITDGILYVQCKRLDGAWGYVLDNSTGEKLTVAASGEDVSVVDISSCIPFNTPNLQFRFATASAQVSEETIYLEFSS